MQIFFYAMIKGVKILYIIIIIIIKLQTIFYNKFIYFLIVVLKFI